MITSLHMLIYSDDAPATRAFLRDVLRWPCVEHDAGSGWLIFRTGPSELGVHPTSGMHEGRSWSEPRQHSILLMCDDLEATTSELKGRGAEFAGDVQEFDFGRGTMLKLPGADDVLLYQPLHPLAYDL